MPWVPIHESGVEFQFYSDGPTLEGSLVRNGAGIRTTYFEFFMPQSPSRIRATCNYYSAGSGHSGSIYTPAYFSFWHPPFGDETRVTNQAPPYPSEHFEDDNGVIDFVPKVVESSIEADMVEFYGTYVTSDYMGVDHAYEFLIEVWVDGPNPDPDPEGLVARDDEATTSADTPVVVDVLANDTLNDEPVALDQLDGPPTIHQQPANGTVSVAPDGKITYTPNPGFTGTDEFVYRIAVPGEEVCIKLRVVDAEGRIEVIDDAPSWFDPQAGFDLRWEHDGSSGQNHWAFDGSLFFPLSWPPLPETCEQSFSARLSQVLPDPDVDGGTVMREVDACIETWCMG